MKLRIDNSLYTDAHKLVRLIGGAGISFSVADDEAGGELEVTVDFGQKDMTLAAGVDLAFNATTGTKLGTAASQKLGFWGATAIIQPALTADLLDSLQAAGLIASGAGDTPLDLTNGAFAAGAGTFNGALTSKHATAGVGYSTGAGGTVTQITSASTGVTLNKATGQITTVALTTAAGAEERFTVTNSAVAATDVVVCTTTYAGAGTPAVVCGKVAAGSFDVVITNLHAANALDALMVINFAVIKGVAA